jgi:molybdenum cofactor cytidylyltransferase
VSAPPRPAGILLAAGASTRLGRPKQLLRVRGETFLRRLAGELRAVAAPVVVVLAPDDEASAAELRGIDVELVRNPEPGRGQSSSIVAAAAALESRASTFDGLLLLLVDQPLVDRGLLERLLRRGREAGGWAAADYGAGDWGPPVHLPNEALAELKELSNGDRGARDLLEARRVRVARLSFPAGRLDIDTAADYDRLLATLESRDAPAAGEPDGAAPGGPASGG